MDFTKKSLKYQILFYFLVHFSSCDKNDKRIYILTNEKNMFE